MSAYQVAVPVGQDLAIEVFAGYLVSWSHLPTVPKPKHTSQNLAEVLRLLGRDTAGVELPVLNANTGAALVVALRTYIRIPSLESIGNVAEYVQQTLAAQSTLRWSHVPQMADLGVSAWETGHVAFPTPIPAKDILDRAHVSGAAYVYATYLQKPVEMHQVSVTTDRASVDLEKRYRIHLLFNSKLICIHEGYAHQGLDSDRPSQFLYCPVSRSRIWGGFVLARNVVDAWLHRRGIISSAQGPTDFDSALIAKLKAEIKRKTGKSLAVHRIHPLWKNLSYARMIFGTVQEPTWYIHTHNIDERKGRTSAESLIDQCPVKFCGFENEVDVNSFENFGALFAFLKEEGLTSRLKYEEIPARPLILE
ncbi:hypothetical protein GLOTRDRAFT_129224 [Gloeophyllum trabeum ATCC 11539]|uniref:Uncharacterized protein n=1 Tax=Gloeophyllum trabeum (strain ATCC 11539 / FP-39264 / Madison 617) TaxID=670483 RepID=S7Q7P2_GLOTA|nr:uncharacterized protein GLOTRDRAFT_129224 [Gloeophyllum trabeum ATCC 11539]EPQ56021.1 hypothetical protein GLOTRDRAFT_129224 [Gloeophyllum trabeum ATCC 11539]